MATVSVGNLILWDTIVYVAHHWLKCHAVVRDCIHCWVSETTTVFLQWWFHDQTMK